MGSVHIFRQPIQHDPKRFCDRNGDEEVVGFFDGYDRKAQSIIDALIAVKIGTLFNLPPKDAFGSSLIVDDLSV